MYALRPKQKIKQRYKTYIGYTEILKKLLEQKNVHQIAVECFPGVDKKRLIREIKNQINKNILFFDTDEFYQKSESIEQILQPILTEDRVFGHFSSLDFTDFLQQDSLSKIADLDSKNIDKTVLLVGVGASQIIEADCVIYVSTTKWNIQLSLKAGTSNWLANNEKEDVLKKIKRSYYFEWPAADELKKKVLPNSHYFIDLSDSNHPKMMTSSDYIEVLKNFSNNPFRLVPYFDPGIWGGKWMQENFNVDKDKKNLAWCFDGVPEENSIIFDIGSVEFEVPGNDIYYFHPIDLLGEKVFGRYGSNFPIRFDFLDTMSGGNLSLQVHPTLDYAYRNFGLSYTQDESYYIMDCKENAYVYLGLKSGITKEAFVEALSVAQITGKLDVEKYINKIPVKKHDHFLIPAGTIHCSGKDCVVLEISATPNRFTFKLWDWGRVDDDGKPRPIHLDHGKNVINERMNTTKVWDELVNQTVVLETTEEYKVEKIGLHPLESIETWRLTIDSQIVQSVEESFNMLNLVEGTEVIIESPNKNFNSITLNYGETVIIPETLKEYTIRPTYEQETCKVMKAFVR